MSGFEDLKKNQGFSLSLRAAVTIPAVASASVLQSAAVGGSVVGVVGSL